MILNHMLEMYLLMWISVVAHEIAHYIAAKAIKLKIHSVYIGDRFFSIKFRKLNISPMIFSGSYVEFFVKDITIKTKFQKIIFFISGPVANLVMFLVAYLLRETNSMYMEMLIWINIYFFIANVFPFFIRKNDIGKLKKYI